MMLCRNRDPYDNPVPQPPEEQQTYANGAPMLNEQDGLADEHDAENREAEVCQIEIYQIRFSDDEPLLEWE